MYGTYIKMVKYYLQVSNSLYPDLQLTSFRLWKFMNITSQFVTGVSLVQAPPEDVIFLPKYFGVASVQFTCIR